MSGYMTYAQKLAAFKSHESPEAVLLLVDAPELIRTTVAWTNTTATIRTKLTKYPRAGGSNAWWDWLWENTEYSRQQLVQKTGLSEYLLDRRLRMLIENRIIYPDGTIHSLVQRYLRERVLKLFHLKPQRAGAKKA
jgi:hypothetical protein